MFRQRSTTVKTQFSPASISLFMVLAFFPFKNIYAQGFYFNAGGGYGFSTANINHVDLCPGIDYAPPYYYFNYPSQTPFSFTGANQTYTQTSIDGNETWTQTYQSLNKGLGGGPNFYASAGYAFTKNISAEIGFSYLAATTLQSVDEYNNDYYGTRIDTSYETETYTNILSSSARYRLIPAIKFSVPLSKFSLYAKAGLVVGLGGKLTLSNTFTASEYYVEFGQLTNYPTETVNAELIASGGLSLGYTASIGAEYSINNFLSVYAELNLINENWSPSNGDITTYAEKLSLNSYSAFVPLTSVLFTYSNNINSGGGIQTSSNGKYVYNQYPSQIIPYGSYGINIGVKFSIPQKTKATTPPATKTDGK